MKFAVFVPNSCQLYLILAKLVHELGTHTHWDTLHQYPAFFQRSLPVKDQLAAL